MKQAADYYGRRGRLPQFPRGGNCNRIGGPIAATYRTLSQCLKTAAITSDRPISRRTLVHEDIRADSDVAQQRDAPDGQPFGH
jgi:hypothetical protein